MTTHDFSGKVAIVTGSGGGIGAEYARALASAGASVVVAELDEAKGEAVAASINEAGGAAAFVRTDVGSEESTLAMAKATEDAFGGIDYLVNNAAIFGGMKNESLLDVDWSYYQTFMNVNMNGALLCARACVPSMEKRGGGAIVNQSSTAAWMGLNYYGVAKFGLNGLTLSLSKLLGAKNIRVNAIAPGPTDTDAMRGQVPEEYLPGLLASIPLSRLGTPKDMADGVLFLLSDSASWVTGQIFAVDGGQIIRG